MWSLANRWAEIVGPQVAQHVTVLSFAATPDEEQAQPPRRSEVLPQAQQTVLLGDEAPVDDSADLRHGGKLTLIADDAAWQQQIVWGLPHLQRRLDAELGAGVVGRIVVLGPQERRRKYGSRRVKR